MRLVTVLPAVLALGLLLPTEPGPHIQLADHTVATAPPADPGDGSLPGGDALTPFDVGGVGADQWLIANGPRFGLCRIYANELWHFERATGAMGVCPPLLPKCGLKR